MAKAINEIGHIYKGLEVIERDLTRKNRAYWLCKCLKCGEIYSIDGAHLRNGQHSSCLKCIGNANVIDEIEKRYGKLIVIQKEKNFNDRHIYWKCKCDCGNVEIIKGTDLRAGIKTMCKECNKKPQYKNEIGNKYGKLTVIAYDKEKSKKNAYWLCQCDCGNIISVLGTKLRNNHTQSCGCLKSKGEEKIIKLLIENNIIFKTQVSFPKCKDIDLLKFDFGIFDNFNNLLYLIEYDGIQHFKSDSGWNTKENVENNKKKDKIKNNYCFDNNIPLIRIPYTHLDNLSIKDLLLETSKFKLFKEK